MAPLGTVLVTAPTGRVGRAALAVLARSGKFNVRAAALSEGKDMHDTISPAYQFEGFAMPPTPFLGSGASFQGLGTVPMASSRQAIGISLIESFWRAFGIEIQPFRDSTHLAFPDFALAIPTLATLAFASLSLAIWLLHI